PRSSSSSPGVSAPDFVAIGHVTLDRFGESTRPGGSALYAAVTAHRLGLSVGLLTSHGDEFPRDVVPSKIEVVSVPAADTTLFEHRHEPGGRVSHVRAAAAPLTMADVPEDWREASLTLLAPVVDEVDPMTATLFTDGAGDVFAAAFLIQYQRDGDPWLAAAAAACAGSLAVEGEGWSAVADRAALDAALSDYQRAQ